MVVEDCLAVISALEPPDVKVESDFRTNPISLLILRERTFDSGAGGPRGAQKHRT
jgi:hypothetical protein